MVMRFLFCLTSSLLSGSVIAVLLTAVVQHAFPEASENQQPALGALATNQDGRPAKVPQQREPATEQTSPEIRAVALRNGAPEPPAPEQTTDATVQQDSFSVLRSRPGSSVERERYPEFAVLTQQAAQNRGQLLAASGTTGLLEEGVQEAQATEAAPDPPKQPDKLAGIAQPTTGPPTQERDPATDPLIQQNARDHKPTTAASPVARGAHVRTAIGSRTTRSRQMTRGSHADHAHGRTADRSADHRGSSQQARRQAQN